MTVALDLEEVVLHVAAALEQVGAAYLLGGSMAGSLGVKELLERARAEAAGPVTPRR